MSCERWLLVLIFMVTTKILGFVSSQVQPDVSCSDNGLNYTSNSIFEANLNTLFSSLPTNVSNNGYYNASVGQNPDRANVIVLCRGDIQLDTCRSCVQEAIAQLVKSCPNQKQGAIWYEVCTLRYSNVSIFGTLVTSPSYFVRNQQNSTSPDQFNEDLRTLLDNLTGRAAYGGSLRKVAAESRTTSDFQTIFALLQCTPDLSPEDCRKCLVEAIADIPKFCDRKIGCRVLKPSCNLRHEISPFYNETRLQELRVLAPEPVPSRVPGRKDDNTTKTVIIIVVSIGCVLVAICVVILIMKRIKQKSKEEVETVEDISTAESLHYDFGKIRAATKDFSDANKLGQGGFGDVYKGRLLNGQEIAVKRLSMDSQQGELQFKNEVLLLAKLQHRNLVRLLGYSIEGNEKLLVYEFVQNGSLDQFIFDPIKRSYLDWEKNYKIIMGIARGLLYLHEDSRLTIIHRDLKASNVLLDGEMNPKVADFGMAKIFVPDESQGYTSKIVGTYGYMAPEYAMHGKFSVKSDVFSFGVLVLEILSGQKNNSSQIRENVEDLINCAWEHWRQGTAADIIDPVLKAGSGIMRDMLRCIHIGLLCVQENVTDRPTMASVLVMLSSSSLTLPVPLEPEFSVTTRNAREFKPSKSKSSASILPFKNGESIED